MNDTASEVLTIVRRHRELGEVIADLARQQADLKARFEAIVPLGYEVEIDGRKAWKNPPNRAFDLALAIDVAHLRQIPVRMVEVADQADLKARLTAAGLIDDAMRPGTGANRVSL